MIPDEINEDDHFVLVEPIELGEKLEYENGVNWPHPHEALISKHI